MAAQLAEWPGCGRPGCTAAVADPEWFWVRGTETGPTLPIFGRSRPSQVCLRRDRGGRAANGSAPGVGWVRGRGARHNCHRARGSGSNSAHNQGGSGCAGNRAGSGCACNRRGSGGTCNRGGSGGACDERGSDCACNCNRRWGSGCSCNRRWGSGCSCNRRRSSCSCNRRSGSGGACNRRRSGNGQQAPAGTAQQA